jgi:hypothetical protein
MSIAIHGDKSLDDHFDKLTDDAERILGSLTNLADQVEDIFAGKVLNKSGHMYFVNQSKKRLTRALPLFEQLIVQIKDKLRIRNEQSSIYRDRRDAEKEIERQRNEFKSDLEVAEEEVKAVDGNFEPEESIEDTGSVSSETGDENNDPDAIANDDTYTY